MWLFDEDFSERICVANIDKEIWWPALKFDSLFDFVSTVSERSSDYDSDEPSSAVRDLISKATLQYGSLKMAANMGVEHKPGLAYLLGRSSHSSEFVILPEYRKEILHQYYGREEITYLSGRRPDSEFTLVDDFNMHRDDMLTSGSEELKSAVNLALKRMVKGAFTNHSPEEPVDSS